MKRNAENPNLAEHMEQLERQQTLLWFIVIVQGAILFITVYRLHHLYVYTNQLMNCLNDLLGNLDVLLDSLSVMLNSLNDALIGLHGLLVGLKSAGVTA